MTQRFSQNGWPAYSTTEHYARFTAAEQGWWAANADVAVVFTEFIDRFVREVEPIDGKVLDDWSYANRLVRGSTSVVSNHGSATAIDLNALKHPRGVPDTFSPAEQRTMHRIRDAITDDAGRPVLRLGMDYRTTVDDMHVEIDANATRVRQAANKIRKRNQEKDEDDMALSTEDVEKIAQRAAELVWLGSRKLAPADPKDKPQTPGGLLRTIGDRTFETNLEAQVQDGITKALTTPGHQLAVQFGALKETLDQVLERLPVGPTPAP